MSSNAAIHASLTELRASIELDRTMIRNIRTSLVKKQVFERVTALQIIEQRMEELLAAIDTALS